jgi:hypothetical protein
MSTTAQAHCHGSDDRVFSMAFNSIAPKTAPGSADDLMHCACGVRVMRTDFTAFTHGFQWMECMVANAINAIQRTLRLYAVVEWN